MDILKIILSTLTVFLCATICDGQLYTSTLHVSRLARLEQNLVQSLQRYLQRQEKNGITFDDSIAQFLEAANQTNERLNQTIKASLDNPISTYHLLRRILGGWAELKKNMTCEGRDCPILTGEDVFKAVLKREKVEWPTESDLQSAAKAVVNIWNVHVLDLRSFTNGSLMDLNVDPLSADDIFYIGSAAKDSVWFYEAITWYEHLRSELDNLHDVSFEKSTLYRRLASAYFEYGMRSKAIELLEEMVDKEPDKKAIARDLSYYRSATGKGESENITEVTRYKQNEDNKKTNKMVFEELCRNSLENAYVATSLSCSIRPLYKTYGVILEEVVSMKPRIVILHDVLNATEVRLMRKYAETAIHDTYPSPTSSILVRNVGYDGARLFVILLVTKHNVRICDICCSGSVCEFNPGYRLLTNLTQRLEQMTNLYMFPQEGVSSSECYQFTNHGVGNAGKLVDDAWEADNIPFSGTGNRMVTAVYRFSDVSHGGEVVFPRLGVVVPHIKGSVVLWENLRREGTPNPKMKHANCPVIAGSYWAATKHILYNNQAFRKPCDVTSKEAS